MQPVRKSDRIRGQQDCCSSFSTRENMPNSYDVLRDHYSETLLGRLKLITFEQITGNDEDMPTNQEVWHFIAEQYRSNSEVGTLLLYLLSIGSAGFMKFAKLQEPGDLLQLLSELDERPLERARFLEMTDCPEPLPPRLGALVYCEQLREGGYVYIVTLLDDTEFPDCFAGRAEIRSSQAAPEPAFGILDDGEYVSYSLRNHRENPWAVLMTKILNYVNDTRFERFVPVAEVSRRNLQESSALAPPTDRRYLMLLQLVKMGKVTCAEAEVDLSLVRPYDLDFCLSYPVDVVDELAQRMESRSSDTRRLLVYWHRGALVMSDDYGYYLAYRKLGYSKVPVVIMGPFPHKIVGCPRRVGGVDLVPPIVVSRTADYSNLSPELKDFILAGSPTCSFIKYISYFATPISG
jgi:hypothetical protein